MTEEHGLVAAIRKILEDASIDVAEERAIKYIVRELHNGRSIDDILNDPFIRNRVNEQELDNALGNPEILKAVKDEMGKAFKDWDFKFEE